MKKIIIILSIVLSLLLVAVACLLFQAKKNANPQESTGTTAATQETTNTNQIAEDKTMVAVSVPDRKSVV